MGRLALLFAIVNMSMGVFYGVLEWVWFSIWFAYLGINVVLYVGLEIRIWWLKETDDGPTSMDLNATYDETTFGKTDSSPAHFKSNQTLCEDLSSIAKFNSDQFQTQKPTQLKAFKTDEFKVKSPKTPPPPYLTTRNYYVKSTSPKLTTPKPAQLLAFSEAKASHHQAKPSPKSYAKQLLVDSQNDDSEHEVYVMHRPSQHQQRPSKQPNPRDYYDYEAYDSRYWILIF